MEHVFLQNRDDTDGRKWSPATLTFLSSEQHSSKHMLPPPQAPLFLDSLIFSTRDPIPFGLDRKKGSWKDSYSKSIFEMGEV